MFLLSGVYLTYRIRNAKKEIYKEKLTLTMSLLLESIVSLTTYIIKHTLWTHPNLHPDHILLLYAIRCQSTVTPMIIILFMPKVIILYFFLSLFLSLPLHCCYCFLLLPLLVSTCKPSPLATRSCSTRNQNEQHTTDLVIYHRPKYPKRCQMRLIYIRPFYPMARSTLARLICPTWIPKTFG